MSYEHTVSVVVPVYRGARTLPALVGDLDELRKPQATPGGRVMVVDEVLLVHDCGPDDSDAVIRDLAARHPWIRPVWLSRNFGQHAATLAGMASSGGDWVATMDEDGQHDPGDLPRMLDTALDEQADVVYGKGVNPPPHGMLRNLASRSAKRSVRYMTGGIDAQQFGSYRLTLGETARSVAAYAGAGVYLDIALGWVARRVRTCPVELRAEGRAQSGYSLRSLMSHYWRMVITGGTRLLRAVSVFGIVLAVSGFLLAAVVVGLRLLGEVQVQGWSSVIVLVLISSGTLLFSLGIVAEYIGVAVNMAMGKPLYLIVSDRAAGPMGRDRGEPEP